MAHYFDESGYAIGEIKAPIRKSFKWVEFDSGESDGKVDHIKCFLKEKDYNKVWCFVEKKPALPDENQAVTSPLPEAVTSPLPEM